MRRKSIALAALAALATSCKEDTQRVLFSTEYYQKPGIITEVKYTPYSVKPVTIYINKTAMLLPMQQPEQCYTEAQSVDGDRYISESCEIYHMFGKMGTKAGMIVEEKTYSEEINTTNNDSLKTLYVKERKTDRLTKENPSFRGKLQ